MGSTISTYYNTAVGIGAVFPSPLTITSSGEVKNPSSNAVYANYSGVSLFNYGTIIAGGSGVKLNDGGHVSNQASGYISGLAGIYADLGTAAIYNAGIVIGQEDGVELYNGGIVTNASTGTISATNNGGIDAGGFTTVFNMGTITSVDGTGIRLTDGGDVTNALGGSISSDEAGIFITNGSGQVINAGIIHSSAGTGIDFVSGGYISNTSSGTLNGSYGVFITGNGTLINAGSIGGTETGAEITGTGIIVNTGLITDGSSGGVVLQSGSLNNAAGAGIYGAAFGVYLKNAGTIVNNGSISADAGGGVSLGGTGTLENDGRIYGFTTGVAVLGSSYVTNGVNGYIGGGSYGIATDGSINNAGSVFGNLAGINAGSAAVITNNGSVTAGSGAFDNGLKSVGIYMQNGTFINGDAPGMGYVFGVGAGVYAGQAGATVQNDGHIYGGLHGIGVDFYFGGTFINAGVVGGGSLAVSFGKRSTAPSSLVVEQGALFKGGVAANAGAENGIELTSGSSAGTLDMGSSFSGFDQITFDAGSSWALAGDVSALAGGQVITGFDLPDMLIVEGFTASSENFVAGTGLELSDGGTDITLDVTPAVGHSFQYEDVTGGTEIFLCYLRGTKILTPRGDVAVEELAIGDDVATRFGGVQRIKFLGQQRYALQFVKHNYAQLPVKISAGALGHRLPLRDLFVSPGHSLLLGETLVLASSLVNGVTITQGEAPDEIHYIQIELETHDCVLAEGCWSETYADAPGLRAKYHNAAEFWALYPDYVTPAALALCAPRPERGAALAAALQPVVARAAEQAAPGKLQGWIDWIGPDGLIEGWAWDAANPELPVLLEIWAGAEKRGSVLACDARADLAAAGYGQGRCSFAFRGRPAAAGEIEIRRAADGAVLQPAVDLAARLGRVA